MKVGRLISYTFLLLRHFIQNGTNAGITPLIFQIKTLCISVPPPCISVSQSNHFLDTETHKETQRHTEKTVSQKIVKRGLTTFSYKHEVQRI